MPEINIPAKVRFVLYLLAALGGLFVQYAIDKTWFGDAEFRLWSGVASLLMLLAAAKTNLASVVTTVKGMVTSPQTGETGAINATLSTTSEATGADLRAEEGDDGLSYEESGGRSYPEGQDYGVAPDPRTYPRTIEDGSPDR